MLNHYLIIVFRNLLKYKSQSLIAIFGLAFGVACFVPAFYWLRYETMYDAFYPDAGRIYRIYAVEKQSGKVNERVPGILETKLHEHFPATDNSAGFFSGYNWNFSAEGTSHIRLKTLFADSAFFRIFPQVFIAGDALPPMQDIHTLILTESAAIRLFGDVEKAIGQPIKNKQFTDSYPPFIVSSVVKDPPQNTNISFEVIQFPIFQYEMTAYMPEESQWTYFDKELYVKLNARSDIEALAGQLRDFTSRLNFNANIELRMLPISDIRHKLNTGLPFTLGFIRLFVAAGLLLLFSAFFNFLNLYFGLFTQRFREMRQRMVSGATNGQLILQTSFELTCTALLALLLSWLFVTMAQPLLSDLLDISIKKSQVFHSLIICGIAVIAILLLVGFFPLWRMCRSVSRCPTKAIPARRSVSRHIAVSMQLAVSVIFIIVASVVMMQLRFVSRKDMGFDRHGIIQLSGLNPMMRDNQRTALIHELASIPQIEIFTSTNFEPQHDTHGLIVDVEWPEKPLYERPSFQFIAADHRFAETYGLKMIQGEWLAEGERQKIVLNEEAVRVMRLSDPIGSVIRMYPALISSLGTQMQEFEVAGVVADFHTLSLRSAIYPTIFRNDGYDTYLYLRVGYGQEQDVIKRIRAFLPDIDASLVDVRLTPLDELYDRLNHAEQTGLKLFAVLATVCLLISLFGIYAIAVATTRLRRKEIAIRKVTGAAVVDIVRMFLREFLWIVLIAGITALPVAYGLMNKWLQGYAYHTGIPWWLLSMVIVVMAAIVMTTVIKHVLKAANQNPAEVVKTE